MSGMAQVQEEKEIPTSQEWHAVADFKAPVWTLGSVWRRYHVDTLWLGLYVLANALIFWLRFRQYDADPCVARGPAVAKGSAEVVMFNCVLSLLSVCHRALDKLRSTTQRPVEMHRECHVLTGTVALVLSFVHSVAWGLIVYWSHTCDARDWQRSSLATGPATKRLRESAMLDSLPMWTGIAMVLGAAALLPFCMGPIRRKWFTAFECVHRVVLVPFLILLLFHGAAQWTSRLQAPLWLVPALVLFLVERRSRLSQRTNSTILCFDTTPPATHTTIRLFLVKTERFQRCFEPGMFVYLQVPAISSLEWHPFSVCSSPEDPLVELHIRVVGDWTKRLHSLLQDAVSSTDALDHTLVPVGIPVRLDGPFGTPTIHVARYDSVLLVALGVGIAPFLSVLRHRLHTSRHTPPTIAPAQRVSLVWVVRDLALVEWAAETFRELDDHMGRDARVDLQVFVTADAPLSLPVAPHVRVHGKAGTQRRPHWPLVLDEWLAASSSALRRAVFVSGSRAATSDLKHAVARTHARVDVYAERFH